MNLQNEITLNNEFCPKCNNNTFNPVIQHGDIYLDCSKCGFNLPDCRNDLK